MLKWKSLPKRKLELACVLGVLAGRVVPIACEALHTVLTVYSSFGSGPSPEAVFAKRPSSRTLKSVRIF